MQDPAWLERRRKGIGGSDANLLVHCPSRWRHLWEVKTGRRDDDDLSGVIRVQVGLATELVNLEAFRRASGLETHSTQLYMVHQTIPFARGTFDALVGDDAFVECKHTSERKRIEDVAEYYRPQLQHYLFVSNRARAYLSVLFGNNRHEWAERPADSEYLRILLGLEKEFWHYVVTDKAPPKWK